VINNFFHRENAKTLKIKLLILRSLRLCLPAGRIFEIRSNSGCLLADIPDAENNVSKGKIFFLQIRKSGLVLISVHGHFLMQVKILMVLQ
jgi:hypothetical protein